MQCPVCSHDLDGDWYDGWFCGVCDSWFEPNDINEYNDDYEDNSDLMEYVRSSIDE